MPHGSDTATSGQSIFLWEYWLREADSVAARLITSTGADLNKLYTDIINVFSSQAPSQGSGD